MDMAMKQTTVTSTTPDAGAFREAMGQFSTGVAIITCGSGPATEVITANSLTSISLDPLLLLISIRSDGKIRSKIERAGGFAVNILSEAHRDLSSLFARRDRPSGDAAAQRLGGLTGEHGHVLVPDALASLECELDTQHTGGDHVMFIGRVVTIRLGERDRNPLITYRGDYVNLSPRKRSEWYVG